MRWKLTTSSGVRHKPRPSSPWIAIGIVRARSGANHLQQQIYPKKSSSSLQAFSPNIFPSQNSGRTSGMPFNQLEQWMTGKSTSCSLRTRRPRVCWAGTNLRIRTVTVEMFRGKVLPPLCSDGNPEMHSFLFCQTSNTCRQQASPTLGLSHLYPGNAQVNCIYEWILFLITISDHQQNTLRNQHEKRTPT